MLIIKIQAIMKVYKEIGFPSSDNHEIINSFKLALHFRRKKHKHNINSTSGSTCFSLLF